MHKDKELIDKNRRGLIHAPDESEEAFLLRCHQACLSDSAVKSKRAKRLFDIEPDWVHIRYSDQRLRLWEGGCTWIEADQVTLQLRKVFEKKKRYLGYSREEIFAHELVHVVRNGFEEPVFEEVLAYQTSPSWLRRFFGPIFRSPKESLFFVGALFIMLLSTLFATFQTFVYLGTLSFVSYGTFRLIRTQRIFARAREQIAQIVGKQRALAVMIRLTDREIIRFSTMEKEQIVSYAVKLSRTQVRWRQIRSAYLRPAETKTSKLEP